MPTLSEVCPGRSPYSALVVIKPCDYGLLRSCGSCYGRKSISNTLHSDILHSCRKVHVSFILTIGVPQHSKHTPCVLGVTRQILLLLTVLAVE